MASSQVDSSIIRKDDMATTSADAQRRKQTKRALNTRRGHLSKTNLQSMPQAVRRSGTAAPGYRETPGKIGRRKPVGPGTQRGASKDIPIIIEDEEDGDDNEMEKDLFGRLNALCNSSLASSPTPSFRSIYSSLSRTSTPTGDSAHATPSFMVESNVKTHEPSIYTDAAQLNTRESLSTIRDAKRLPTVCEYSSSTRKSKIADVNLHVQTTDESSVPMSTADGVNERDRTLGEIPDYDTKRIADITAIAPALPVKDIYGTLMDLTGDVATARKQAVRGRQALSARPLIKSGLPLTAGLPRNFVTLTDDSDDDEVMVKIEPNDAFLEWDEDELQSPEVSQRRTQSKKLVVTKSCPSKSKSGVQSKILSPNIRLRKSAQLTKHQPTISVMRTNSSQATSKSRRRNSITRQFIVPDNVVYLDTDLSSSNTDRSKNDSSASDSDIEMLEAVPEDVDNLRIDMEPQYVYNACLLNNTRKG